jgi:ferrous iron transport protein B
MKLKIALVGNPNSGKTTMFNALTGSSQYVGNWPGVTVEKKEGVLKQKKDVTIADLPGIYSLSPYSLEEVITRDFLLDEKPDAIINIVDASNLERNLYLTTQLMEMGIPTVIALNMMDVVNKSGDVIDINSLEKTLGLRVVPTSAVKGKGIDGAARAAIDAAIEQQPPKPVAFETEVEETLAQIETKAALSQFGLQSRWYAVKVFERDEKTTDKLELPKKIAQETEALITKTEKAFDDDAESIMIDQRYRVIGTLMEHSVKKGKEKLTASDKIDRVVTNRWLALPIFAVVMFCVYYVSISTVGDWVTGWTNDVLFGDVICGNLSAWFESISVAPWLSGLVVDGIIGGVGAVLGFVPQMLVLFLMLSILEDVGYMARVAFIMDRIFRKFGLSGKSFIPMLIGSGCSVPGIMASRTIENERDRRMTIMTTSFIPCGAKMPIIGLFAGALFGGAGWVATSAYFIGVAAVIISGIILKKMKPFAGKPSPFVMELPAYHIPAVSNVLHSTWERGWSFIKRAGTVILASSVVLWFLQAFGAVDGVFQMVEDNNTSLLAAIGNFIAPIFKPLGFGNWKAAVATFTGLIAKENVVGTFGVLYGFSDVAENGAEIWTNLALDYTGLTAYSFMLFNLLCAPCFAAMGAIKQEMNNAKWTWAAIGYLCAFAYVISLIVYQFGMLFIGGGFGVGTCFAFVCFAGLLYLLFRKNKYDESGALSLAKKVNVDAVSLFD